MGRHGALRCAEDHFPIADLTVDLVEETSDKKAISGDSGSTRFSDSKVLSGDSGDGGSGDMRLQIDRESAADFRSPQHDQFGHIAVAPGCADDAAFDPRNTNLDFFYPAVTFAQAISEGQFTKLKGLSECCRSDGKIEVHRWSTNCHDERSWAHHTCQEDRIVVVKRVKQSRVGANVGRERNERVLRQGHCPRHAEDCLNEIGVYCYLARQHDLPEYLLRMHTVFQAGTDVWLVLEHANGGDLFAVVQKLKREGVGVPLSHFVAWTWQLLQAVCYLHRHGIGHRDISMENVLLRDGTVRLMDFGQAVQTHSSGGEALRYFSAVGKPYYRPPECHGLAHKTVQVHVPNHACPGQVALAQTTAGDCLCEVLLPSSAEPGKVCSAEPWGYTVPPVDMFAFGVCMFIMATGMPPWRQANITDQHFTWVHQCGIAQLLKAWKKSVPRAAEELMAALLVSVPNGRPSAEQCLQHRWFEPMRGMALPVHQVAEPLPVQTARSSPWHLTSAESHPGVLATHGVSECGAFGFAEPYVRDQEVRSVAAAGVESSVVSGALPGDFYAAADMAQSFVASSFPEELSLQRFKETDIPPAVPPGASYSLEPSTFHASAQKPSTLGNQLLDFLALGAGAVVTKLSNSKFSFKAEVDGEAGACSMKIRIYDEGEGRYAVEFQRRAGESTALHKVFDEARAQFETAKPCDGKGPVADDQNIPTKCGTKCGSRASKLEPRGQRLCAKTSLTPLGMSVGRCVASDRPCSEPPGPAGSGLNAVRWRGKSTLRLAGSRSLPAAGRFNATV